MEVVFLRAAESDLFEIYEKGGEVAHEKIEVVLNLIKSQPKIGTPCTGSFRRKMVIRTPLNPNES